jgi:hypothetical protein
MSSAGTIVPVGEAVGAQARRRRPVALISRTEQFSSAHRLHNPDLSDEENSQVSKDKFFTLQEHMFSSLETITSPALKLHLDRTAQSISQSAFEGPRNIRLLCWFYVGVEFDLNWHVIS